MEHTYETDAAELRWLRKTRRQLEKLAYLFERLGKKCRGECDDPIHICYSAEANEYVDCCNLFPTWERFHELKRLERAVARKVNAGRPAHEPAGARAVSAPLKDAYHRTHTGTYVGSKGKLMQEGQEGTQGEGEDEVRAKVPP